MGTEDLISRKRLLDVLRNTPDIAGLGLEPVIATQTAIELIEIAPAVDAVPVVHGRWEDVEDMWDDTHYRCSVCKCEWFLEDGTPSENGMKFCPHCGAKMDGERRDDP